MGILFVLPATTTYPGISSIVTAAWSCSYKDGMFSSQSLLKVQIRSLLRFVAMTSILTQNAVAKNIQPLRNNHYYHNTVSDGELLAPESFLKSAEEASVHMEISKQIQGLRVDQPTLSHNLVKKRGASTRTRSAKRAKSRRRFGRVCGCFIIPPTLQST